MKLASLSVKPRFLYIASFVAVGLLAISLPGSFAENSASEQSASNWLVPLEGELTKMQAERLIETADRFYYKTDWPVRMLIQHGDEQQVIEALQEARSSADPETSTAVNIALFCLDIEPDDAWNSILGSPALSFGRPVGLLLDELNPDEDIDKIDQLRSIDPFIVRRFAFIPAVLDDLIENAEKAVNINANVRYVQALGEIPKYDSSLRCDSRVLDVLMTVAEEGSVVVADDAIQSIGRHGLCSGSFSFLEHIYETKSSELLQYYAIGWIVLVADKEQIYPYLLEYPGLLGPACLVYGADDDLITLIADNLEEEPPDSFLGFIAILKLYGPDGARLIPSLISIIEENLSENDRVDAIYALASMGDEASAASPLLAGIIAGSIDEQSVSADDNPVLLAAIEAIGCIGTDDSSCVARIREYAEESDGLLRLAAINSMCNLDDEGRSTIPLLRGLLDGDPDLSSEAIIRFRLYRFGIDTEENAQRIRDILELRDNDATDYAIWCLAHMGYEAEPAIVRIEELAYLVIGAPDFPNALPALYQIQEGYMPPYSKPVIIPYAEDFSDIGTKYLEIRSIRF